MTTSEERILQSASQQDSVDEAVNSLITMQSKCVDRSTSPMRSEESMHSHSLHTTMSSPPSDHHHHHHHQIRNLPYQSIPTSNGDLIREESFCSDFICCGIKLPDLHALQLHYERVHAKMEPWVDCPKCDGPCECPDSVSVIPSLQRTSFIDRPPSAMDNLTATARNQEKASNPQGSSSMSTTNQINSQYSSLPPMHSYQTTNQHYPTMASNNTAPPHSAYGYNNNAYRGHQNYVGYRYQVQSNSNNNNNTGSYYDPYYYSDLRPQSAPPASLAASLSTIAANPHALSNLCAMLPSVFNTPQTSTSMLSMLQSALTATMAVPSSNSTSNGFNHHLNGGVSSNRSRPSDTRNDNPRPYVCPIPGCNKTYKNPNGLKYHSIHGHEKDAASTSTPQTSESNPHRSPSSTSATFRPPPAVERPHRCSVPGCNKRYKNPNGLKYHMKHGHRASSSFMDSSSSPTYSSQSYTNGNASRMMMHNQPHTCHPSMLFQGPVGNGTPSELNRFDASNLDIDRIEQALKREKAQRAAASALQNHNRTSNQS